MASRLLRPVGQLLKKCTQATKIQPLFARAASSSALDNALTDLPPTRLSILDNGFKVASQDSDSPLATVGVWIDCGSRHEKYNMNGVCRFFERLAFRGTQKRSQSDLELEVESMGARLQSYVGREHMGFYANCMSKDVPRMVEILSDVIEHCKMGEAEMDREREVFLNELDDVSVHQEVMDHLHAVAYQQTTLGQSVYGTTHSIKTLHPLDLQRFVSDNVTAPRMVLVGAGGVKHDALAEMAAKHFKGYKGDELLVPALPSVSRYTGSEVRVRDDDMPFAHIAIAVEGPGRGNHDNWAMEMGNLLMGSPTWDKTKGLYHSAFNLDRAFTDGDLGNEFRTFNLSYEGTGLWGIYFVTGKMQILDLTYNIQQYWMRLCENLTDMDLERGKNNLIRQILVKNENRNLLCKDIAESMIHNGRHLPMSDNIAEIKALTTAEVRDTLNNYINDMCPVQAGIGPIEQMEDYNRLRSGSSWVRT